MIRLVSGGSQGGSQGGRRVFRKSPRVVVPSLESEPVVLPETIDRITRSGWKTVPGWDLGTRSSYRRRDVWGTRGRDPRNRDGGGTGRDKVSGPVHGGREYTRDGDNVVGGVI